MTARLVSRRHNRLLMSWRNPEHFPELDHPVLIRPDELVDRNIDRPSLAAVVLIQNQTGIAGGDRNADLGTVINADAKGGFDDGLHRGLSSLIGCDNNRLWIVTD